MIHLEDIKSDLFYYDKEKGEFVLTQKGIEEANSKENEEKEQRELQDHINAHQTYLEEE